MPIEQQQRLPRTPAEPNYINHLDQGEKLKRFETVVRRLMPERHALSVVAARIEKRTDRLDDSAFNLERMIQPDDLTELSSAAAQNVENIAKWYETTAVNRRTQQAKLEHHLGSAESAKLGAEVYRYVMQRKGQQGAAPERGVHFLAHPLAFIVVIESDGDYNRLSNWKEKSVGEYHRNSELGGRAADWSGEEYEHVPLALVRYGGDAPPKARELKRLLRNNETVVHELAHSFQHMALELFAKAEARWEHYLSAEDKQQAPLYRYIKDEVVAFFKDGDTNINSIASPDSIYNRLFNLLSAEKQEPTRAIVQRISGYTKQLDSLFPGEQRKDIRRVLYYQLLDIPLPLLPHYLEGQVAYYESLLEVRRMPMSMEAIDRLPMEVYMDPLQPQFVQLRDAHRRYATLRLQADQPVLETARVVMVQQLLDCRNQALEARAAIQTPDSQYVPTFATDIKFLPAEPVDPRCQQALDQLLGFMQQVEPMFINEQFLRLAQGDDYVGVAPGEKKFFDDVQRRLTRQGLAVDQVMIDQCDVGQGIFSMDLRLTLPPLANRPTYRVKAKLNFVVHPDVEDYTHIAASS